ncbi:unnamed protein product [Candidula unifasciata]|uniref:Glutathione S-transferase n=1 Tax=Candidula unifasciata TaxID=100452 RepID=A0A8S3YKL7_9EUPU|nr:unnamed protein product [Candidula unifasciata]
MANSDIKIIYFNIPGRAEVSRLVLVLAGKQFEDVRISGAEWRDIKPTTPFGTCPVLVLDGKMYGQSKAIAVFLAREFGLYGRTNLEGLQIDQAMHLMEDFIQEYGSRYFFVTDEAKKAEGAKQMREEITPRFMGYFEKLLQDNATGYLAGDRVTVADLTVFDMYTGFLGSFVQEWIDKFPLIKQLVATVESNERIRAYREQRK